MGGVADFVGDVIGGAADLVSDTVSWAVDEIVEPVADTVGNVVEGMLDDPVKTAAQIAAIATQQYWALPLIEGADVAAKGGDLDDVLKATAKAYVAQELGSAAGKYAYQGASTAAAGAAYGTSGQQAAMLAAQEASMRTAADIAGQIVGAGAASAGAGIVYGRDPVEALKLGIVSAGSGQLVGLALGELDKQTGGAFGQLRQNSPTAAAAIESAITAQLTGQNVTAAVVSSAIRTSKIATNLVDQFAKDNPGISESQKALAAQVLTNVTATAFAGGDPSRALQATLMQVGSKALGDIAKTEFKSLLTNVENSYKEAQLRAQALDKNIAGQESIASQYNTLAGQLNAKVSEQDRLLNLANQAKATFNSNQTQANADAANAAIRAYNTYADALTKEYNEKFKPQLDKFSNQLSSMQTEYDGLVKTYEEGLRQVQNKTDPLEAKYKDLFANTAQAFVQTMDPNFNAAEYKSINKLGNDVDVYEHWLSEGQYKGLSTNQKDATVSAAIDKYEQEFGEPPPEHILGKLIDPTNADRDKAAELFVNNQIKDKQTQNAYQDALRSRIVDSFRKEGLSDAQINQKIASGEIDNYVNSVTQDIRSAIDAQRDYVKSVGDRYGTNSQEYKDAYRSTLNAMAEVGGYGVAKDGSNFVVDSGAKINGQTLESDLVYLPDGRGWQDPVTGQIHTPLRIDIIVGDGSGYSSLFALGQSAKPPAQGGYSVFGDGSGVSSGLFGGLTFLAKDEATGATLYGGDNGFALITYADGTGAAINPKTNEVIWVSPQKAQEVINKTPVAEPVKPIEADTTKPDPVKPPDSSAIDEVVTEIKDKIQSPSDVKSLFESLGYKPTDTESQQFAGEKTLETLQSQLNQYVDPRQVTRTEAEKFFQDLDYTPTEEELLSYIKQGPTVNQDAIKTEVAKYVDPRYVTRQEIIDAAKAQNVNLTEEQIQKYIGQKDQASTLETAKTELNPLGTTREEAAAIFNDVYGYPPSAEELNQFVKENFPEQQARTDIGAYVDPRQVTRDEAIRFFQSTGYKPTEQEIADYIKQGQDVNQDAIRELLNQYVDPRYVDYNEAADALKAAGITKPSPDDVYKLIGQYQETEAAGKIAADLDAIRFNSLQYQIGQISGDGLSEQFANFRGQLQEQIAANESAGMSRDEALNAAINKVAGDIGTTKENLLAQMGTTEANLRQEFATGISNIQQNFQTRVAELQAQGLSQFEATQQALNEVKLTQSQQFAMTQDQIKQVADFVGKPYRDVTQSRY